jgi:hypothetical protein
MSRTVAEIAADYAKIPPLPPAVTNPIQLSDESDDEIGQMLIDSITSPGKHGPLASPTGSPDQFFTPEQSPAPPAPYDIPNVLYY